MLFFVVFFFLIHIDLENTSYVFYFNVNEIFFSLKKKGGGINFFSLLNYKLRWQAN